MVSCHGHLQEHGECLVALRPDLSPVGKPAVPPKQHRKSGEDEFPGALPDCGQQAEPAAWNEVLSVTGMEPRETNQSPPAVGGRRSRRLHVSFHVRRRVAWVLLGGLPIQRRRIECVEVHVLP
ncbi:uncharacterized protein LOC144169512 [Haemaphysalis longicornis]